MTNDEYVRYFDAGSVARSLGRPGERMRADLAEAVFEIESIDRTWDPVNWTPEGIAEAEANRAALVRKADFIAAEIMREEHRPERIAETRDAQALLASSDALMRGEGIGLIEARYLAWWNGYQERMEDA